MKPSRPAMSVFSLAMLNIIAVDSLRMLPFAASFGFSLVFYYLLAAFFFFIPSALVVAELVTGWPQCGGIYIWVREAFGKRIALFVIMSQWISNICWLPTIMSFLAGVLAYMIEPSLVHQPACMLPVVFVLYASSVLVNLFGIKMSSRFYNTAAILGIMLPICAMTVLGAVWLSGKHPSEITFNWEHFWPEVHSIGSLVFLTSIVSSLIGINMSAIHAQDVKEPQRSYPRALLISTVVILATLIGGSLAIAVVIPNREISLIAGVMQFVHVFADAYGMGWLLNMLGACVILGGVGIVSAWVLGPSRALMIAALDDSLPKFMRRQNRYQVPIGVIATQAVIFTILCSVFLLLPTIRSSYWVLTDMMAIMAMIAHVAMFIVAIRLRYKFPDVVRAYKIPFGKFGMWIVAGVGTFTSLLTIVIGFFPPKRLGLGSIWGYEAILAGGILAFCALPFIFYAMRKH